MGSGEWAWPPGEEATWAEGWLQESAGPIFRTVGTGAEGTGAAGRMGPRAVVEARHAWLRAALDEQIHGRPDPGYCEPARLCRLPLAWCFCPALSQ